MNETESTLACEKCGKPMWECKCPRQPVEALISGTMSATPDNAPQKIVRNVMACLLALGAGEGGRLPAQKDGGQWRFERSRVEEWLAHEKIK